ncbi:Rv3654c family TadE-like protein [Embleya sp. NPDC056575]|uniref:Rv3654c family TadE-like protein n=1 Tax=unclassified Embleya TaxID=2699296 RepID=UPI0036BD4697
MSGGRSGQEGSATLWVLAFALVPMCAAAFVFAFAGAVAARHRAGAAADLAALAAAARSVAGTGPDEACALARRVARAQHTDLTSCRLTNGFAEVRVSAPTRIGTAQATARAGPATPTPPPPDPQAAPDHHPPTQKPPPTQAPRGRPNRAGPHMAQTDPARPVGLPAPPA